MTEFDIQNMLRWKYASRFALLAPNYTPPGWWECDMWAMTKRGYASEYEIKTSVSDFRADARKGCNRNRFHGHRLVSSVQENKHELLAAGDTRGPKQFWFVTPEGMIEAKDVPDFAGLIYIVARRNGGYLIPNVKPAPVLHKTPIPNATIRHVASIFYHRFWSLRNGARDMVPPLATG